MPRPRTLQPALSAPREWSMRRLRVAGAVALALVALLHSGCTPSPVRPPPGGPQHPRAGFMTSVGLEFRLMPAGTAELGGYREYPARTVTMASYYMARNPVTIQQFEAFIRDASWHSDDWETEKRLKWMGEDYPSFLTYATACAFVSWLQQREGRAISLVSSDEWEYGMRGGYSGAIEAWWSEVEPGPDGNWGPDNGNITANPGRYDYAAPGIFPGNPYGLWAPWVRTWTKSRAGGGKIVSRCGADMGEQANHSPDQEWNGIWLMSPVTPADFTEPAYRRPAPTATQATITRTLPRQTLTLAPGVTLDLLECPAGTVRLGRPKEWNPRTWEWPQVAVTLRGPYALGVTEVTQAQFQAVVGRNPSRFPGDQLPVHSLTMVDIVEFGDLLTTRERAAGRLGADEEYRLPTEAEWEQAARAGTDARYPWGDDAQQVDAFEVIDVPGGPQAVGSKLPNPWGFHDLGGNVMELMATYFGEYRAEYTQDTPTWKGAKRDWFTGRGSAWSMGLVASQSTLRRGLQVLGRCSHIGFRLCRGKALTDRDRDLDEYRPKERWRSAIGPRQRPYPVPMPGK